MPKGVEHHRMHRLPDELDGLLRAYFRAEMPHPWPGAPRAAPPRKTALPAGRRYRGRLALAAAVSFFLVGSFALTQHFPAVPEAGPSSRPALSGSELGGQLLGSRSGVKRPHRADAHPTREQLPPLRSDLPKILPLEETPKNRSFGVRSKSGKVSLIVVGEEKAP